RANHEQVRSRGAGVPDEVGDALEQLRVAVQRPFRQSVTVLQLRRAEIPEVTADARLRRHEPLRTQQLDQLRLAADLVRYEQPDDGPPALVLLGGGTRHRRGALNKIAHI